LQIPVSVIERGAASDVEPSAHDSAESVNFVGVVINDA
jgi:hypothetical protein